MGFEFGNVTQLNTQVAMISFIGVIIFIIAFDITVSLMEYFIREYPMYNRMVQMIYKELMLMGLVSFTIIIVEAAANDKQLSLYHSWIVAIDFAHILLFFMTFFFVLHSFYLMVVAASISSGYRRMFLDPTSNIIKEVAEISQENSWRKMFFNFQYLPISSVQERVEFELAHTLFQNTYFLPEGFNFASYLSGCFDRYALKTIDRSLFSWFILSIFVLLNFGRTYMGSTFNEPCASAASSGHRRYLAGTDDHADDHSIPDQYQCLEFHYKIFLLCALCLVGYTSIIMFMTRIYKIRLLRRIGLHTTDDNVDFLKFVDRESERLKFVALTAGHDMAAKEAENKQTTQTLREDIEKILDSDEGGEENEFEEIGEFLTTVFEYLRDCITSVTLRTRICILSVVAPDRIDNRNKSALLLEKSDQSEAKKSSASASNIEAGEHNDSTAPAHHRPRASSDELKATVAQEAEKVQKTNKKAMLDKLKGSAKTNQKAAQKLSFTEKQNQTAAESGQAAAARSGSVMSTNARRTAFITNRDTQKSLLDFLSHLNTGDQPVGPQASGGTTTSSGFRDRRRSSVVINSAAIHKQQEELAKTANHDKNPLLRRQASGTGGSGGRSDESQSRGRSNSVASSGGGVEFVSIIDKYKEYRKRITTSSKRRGSVLPGSASAKTNKRMNLFKIIRAWWSGLSSAGRVGNQSGNSGKAFNDLSKEEGEESEKRGSGEEVSSNFDDIYLFGKPEWFSRAVEMCIMCDCLYLAFWVSNFTTITGEMDMTPFQLFLSHLFMILPVFIVMPCIGYISKTCSLLSAMSELNLEVIHEVLLETEDATVLLDELRGKILSRIEQFALTEEDKMAAIHLLFSEIDQDGSGEIDKVEFRFMLRALKLTYSNQRFKRLYRAIDSNGDNKIGKQELDDFLFPAMKFEREREAIMTRRQSSRQSFSAATAGMAVASSRNGASASPGGAGAGDGPRRVSFHGENGDDSSGSSSGSDDDNNNDANSDEGYSAALEGSTHDIHNLQESYDESVDDLANKSRGSSSKLSSIINRQGDYNSSVNSHNSNDSRSDDGIEDIPMTAFVDRRQRTSSGSSSSANSNSKVSTPIATVGGGGGAAATASMSRQATPTLNGSIDVADSLV